jgi:hypothetical protein
VGVVGAVDEFDVDFCCADEMGLEVEDDCSLPKARECFRGSDLIAVVADWVGGKKKAAGMSWIHHTSDKVLVA